MESWMKKGGINAMVVDPGFVRHICIFPLYCYGQELELSLEPGKPSLGSVAYAQRCLDQSTHSSLAATGVFTDIMASAFRNILVFADF
eukprot:6096561-Amphidinium_carterae.1